MVDLSVVGGLVLVLLLFCVVSVIRARGRNLWGADFAVFFAWEHPESGRCVSDFSGLVARALRRRRACVRVVDSMAFSGTLSSRFFPRFTLTGAVQERPRVVARNRPTDDFSSWLKEKYPKVFHKEQLYPNMAISEYGTSVAVLSQEFQGETGHTPLIPVLDTAVDVIIFVSYGALQRYITADRFEFSYETQRERREKLHDTAQAIVERVRVKRLSGSVFDLEYHSS